MIKNRKWLAVLIAVLMVFAMTGCITKEPPQTIESFMEDNPEVAAAIDENLEGLDYEGAAVSTDYEDNRCIITFKYDETYSDEQIEQLSSAFDENSSKLMDLSEEMIESISNGSTFTDPSVKIIFKDGSDTEIYTYIYPVTRKTDTDADPSSDQGSDSDPED